MRRLQPRNLFKEEVPVSWKRGRIARLSTGSDLRVARSLEGVMPRDVYLPFLPWLLLGQREKPTQYFEDGAERRVSRFVETKGLVEVTSDLTPTTTNDGHSFLISTSDRPS